MADKALIRQEVIQYIEDVSLVSLGEQKIADNDNLFEAGVLDSYGLIELLLYLEKQFAFKLAEEEMASPQLASVAGICAVVVEKTMAAGGV
jgi:acyl carrier protein